MTNLSIRIVLPAGFRLADGRILREALELVVISRLEPYYASVDQVRLLGGGWMDPLDDDLPIAAMIWLKSIEADTLTYQKPPEPPPGGGGQAQEMLDRFLFGRMQYVAHAAAGEILLRMMDIATGRGSKRLGNFEVGQPRTPEYSGRDLLNTLRAEAEQWKIVVQSGGRIGKGGRARFDSASRAALTTPPPSGRMWLVTGMGANRTSAVYYGGEVQLRKFYSPFFYSWYRSGPVTGAMLAFGALRLPLQVVLP